MHQADLTSFDFPGTSIFLLTRIAKKKRIHTCSTALQKQRSETVGVFNFSAVKPQGMAVLPAIFHVDLGATRMLNGDSRGHLIEICIGNQWIVSLQIIHTFEFLVKIQSNVVFPLSQTIAKKLFLTSSKQVFKHATYKYMMHCFPPPITPP